VCAELCIFQELSDDGAAGCDSLCVLYNLHSNGIRPAFRPSSPGAIKALGPTDRTIQRSGSTTGSGQIRLEAGDCPFPLHLHMHMVVRCFQLDNSTLANLVQAHRD